jgi:hypothetical protein
MFNGAPDNLNWSVCHDNLDLGAATNVPSFLYRVRLVP